MSDASHDGLLAGAGAILVGIASKLLLRDRDRIDADLKAREHIDTQLRAEIEAVRQQFHQLEMRLREMEIRTQQAKENAP